uniref:vacuolar protein 8 n=1 Tax=Fragaria vesca subsp. vesca TaxID=101020 RepID=UPI0005CAA90D|nr:PREDICTED: vacuolar protein 8 [Fragaria vesca subsp. vesca]
MFSLLQPNTTLLLRLFSLNPNFSSSAMKDDNDPIAVCTDLLRSLSSEIPLIQIFKGKWALIQSKLTDLQAQLTDFSDFPTAKTNSLSLDLLHSVAYTLRDAVTLARRCHAANSSEGKLRTQSDVDSVLAKLDLHLRDGEILFKSGVLHDTAGFSSSSKRETVRAECRNLVTRLQIGGAESRGSAMEALLALLQEDDKNVMIAVAQGIVPVLVKLLDSSGYEMKENAVAAVSMVAMVESSRNVLAAEGLLLLNHLLRVLDSGSGFAKEKACVALQALSFSKDNARAISRGGVSLLLDICQDGTPGSQASAAGVLRNLAAFAENKENFIEENGVGVLLGLASSGTALAQENAIGCLSHLVSDSESQKVLVFREGGITCLKNFLDSGCGNNRSLEAAVELLTHLASCSLIAEAIVAEGFVTKIVEVMNCGVLGVRIQAAKAVYELGFCSRTRKEMGERGCIPPLVKMLDGKAVEEKEAAAKALSALLLYADNRKIFRKTEGAILSTVQLLNPSLKKLDKKYPVAVLAALVHSKKCKKQMVAAGACVHLQKLLDLEVEGSQKLLESLCRSKIWGVFTRS